MKVLISGAGIAGPTLAYWLHHYGHSVTLVEKSPSLRTNGYVIDFWGLGFDVVEKMGILDTVLSKGYKVQELLLVNDKGERVGGFALNLMAEQLNGRFTSLPRGELASCIFETIAGKVETIFGDSIASLEEKDTEIVVSLERNGKKSFDIVVGCDGLHSNVRQLGFPESERDNIEVYLGFKVAACQVSSYPFSDASAYVSFATPGKSLSRFSLRDDKTLLLFIYHDSNPEVPKTLEERKQEVHRVFDGEGWECKDALACLDTCEDVYLDSVTQIQMSNWTKGRVALVGDAAACPSLLAGEGSGLAIVEAYVLAGELNAYGDQFSKAFENYEQTLKAFITKKQESARGFAGAFAPKTALGLFLRNWISRLLGIPFLARWMLKSLKDDLILPDYENNACQRGTG